MFTGNCSGVSHAVLDEDLEALLDGLDGTSLVATNVDKFARVVGGHVHLEGALEVRHLLVGGDVEKGDVGIIQLNALPDSPVGIPGKHVRHGILGRVHNAGGFDRDRSILVADVLGLKRRL